MKHEKIWYLKVALRIVVFIIPHFLMLGAEKLHNGLEALCEWLDDKLPKT